MSSVELRPFRIDIPQENLDFLRGRLSSVRWPDQTVGNPWRYGTSLDFMHRLVDHWLNGHDWRHWERQLNAFEQYIARIDAHAIHVLIRRSRNENALPLILTHGWPGSVIEYLDIADRLANPQDYGGALEDAFTVIMPSLPGYGFSAPLAQPLSPQTIAGLWHRLVTQGLGFDHYGAHGSDWGGVVSSWLGLDSPPGLRAIHLSGPTFLADWTFAQSPPDEAEKAYIEAVGQKWIGETGYQAIQGSRPLTLSYGLTDSPVGLAAWITEKYWAWTDRADDDPPFDLDTLIAIVMMHWLPGPFAPMAMYSYLLDGSALTLPEGRRVDMPTGICSFPNDLAPPAPDQWIRRGYNLCHRTIATGGGHFPGLERPIELAEDFCRFFAAYR